MCTPFTRVNLVLRTLRTGEDDRWRLVIEDGCVRKAERQHIATVDHPERCRMILAPTLSKKGILDEGVMLVHENEKKKKTFYQMHRAIPFWK